MRIERFVVWTPQASACMSWARARDAERFACYWNARKLLGSVQWRVSAVVTMPDTAGDGAGEPMTSPTRDAANERWITDPDPAAGPDREKDALIEELQRRLNETVMRAAHDVATRAARIVELEARIAELDARIAELERRDPRCTG